MEFLNMIFFNIGEKSNLNQSSRTAVFTWIALAAEEVTIAYLSAVITGIVFHTSLTVITVRDQKGQSESNTFFKTHLEILTYA